MIPIDQAHELTLGIVLKKTSDACPEQYDAIYGGERVGYLRLRHGHFTVECPDCGGTPVYIAHTRGDGSFDDHERGAHLAKACVEIARWMQRREPNDRAEL